MFSKTTSTMGRYLAVILIFGTTFHFGSGAVSTNKTNELHNNAARVQEEESDTVHVVFMNHLDIGYNAQIDRGFVNRVLNRYFGEFFPRAARLGDELSRRGGHNETFVYTTHAWLVSLYMDCPPNLWLAGIKLNCPSPTDLARFTSAVRRGYITWHAAPANLLTEYNHRWLVERGLRLASELDARLNVTRPMRVMSQRDVPGLTQAVIPSLLAGGVTALSVGVNSLSAPPDVPRLFRWAYGGDEIVAAWHPGGYPDNPGPDPHHPGGLSTRDCVTYAGLRHVLCFAFRTDNTGPPDNVTEILHYYSILRAEYPTATIRASTLEDFFVHVQPIRDKLPLVTKEIGDTWIQGAASDPRRNAEYRAMSRVLGECVQEGACLLSERRFWNASRLLLKLAEHTWGLDSTRDTVAWSNRQFYSLRKRVNFVNCTKSWLEQRAFLSLTVQALEDHPVVDKINTALTGLVARRPDLTDYIQLEKLPRCSGKNFDISFDKSGSIVKLRYKQTAWADTSHPLSQFQYLTYNDTDFQAFGAVYNYTNIGPGITKANMTLNARPLSKAWEVKVTRAYRRKGSQCDIWFSLAPSDKTAVSHYGAPPELWLHYDATDREPTLAVSVELVWFDKPPTRLPEAMYLSFSPRCQGRCGWTYSKLGRHVSPYNVVHNGSQYQHGVDDEGVTVIDQSQHSMQITAWDTSVACPITGKMTYPTVFPAPLKPITDEITGVGFNVYNNIWDTNWIFWYPYMDNDQDFKSRYTLKFSE